MVIYWIICSWFISGAVIFLIDEKDHKRSRVNFIQTLIGFSIFGYLTVAVWLLMILSEKYEKSALHDWLHSKP